MESNVLVTFKGSQHGLKVGVSNQRGGGLKGESFLQPIQESFGNLYCEAATPLGEHRHCVYQRPLMN